MAEKPFLRGRRLQLSLAVTAAVAWILQGYDQALMNGLLTLPTFEQTFPEIDTTHYKGRATLQGTAVALYEVGAALGALSCFFIGDKYGRKRPTIGAAIVVLVGVVIQASSYQLPQLIVARIVTGLGVGAFTATLPSWVGESSEANHRGFLIAFEGSGAIFGVMLAGWLELGLFFAPKDDSVSWRFPIAFQAIFPIAVLCVAPFLAESPRWLLSKDRIEEGKAVLALLEDEDEGSEVVEARARVIMNSIYADKQGHSKNPFALTPNRHLNRTLLAIGVNMLAQMSGVNVISFYSNKIFQEDLHFSATLSRVITGCLQTWQFLMATASIFLIDRFGRRRLLIIGACCMAVANAGLAGLQSHADIKAVAGCALIFYFFALAAFPIGLFLIPFMFASEIAPICIRAQVTAMSSATNWLFNFLVAEVTPIAFANIGWKYYLVYVCTNSLSVVVFYLFAPETKGRTLEDIDAIFLGASNSLQPVKMAKYMQPGIAEELDMNEKTALEAERLESVA